MLLIARNVGRLVEVRFSGNPTEDNITAWSRACEACLQECIARTGKGAVCLTDLRASSLFSPAATERLISLMRSDNRALERNAILLTGGAMFTLQMQRMLRESSGESRRRVFVDVDPALTWTDEHLIPAERARLRDFIRESDLGSTGQAEGGFFHWRSDEGPVAPSALTARASRGAKADRTSSTGTAPEPTDDPPKRSPRPFKGGRS